MNTSSTISEITTVSAADVSRPLTLPVKCVRAVFKGLSPLAPSIVADMAFKQFLTPHRFKTPEREKKWLEAARQSMISLYGRQIAVYRWGEGPAVLLVHGWEGRAGQLGAFVKPLLQRGYSVISFDAPAHGASEGRQTNGYEIRDVIKRLETELGAFHAIITHSFGGAATMLALREGVHAGAIVCISPPASLEQLRDTFAHVLSLSRNVRDRFTEKMNDKFGADVWDKVRPESAAPYMTTPALFIHDKDDREVPSFAGERLASLWPQAKLLTTQQLGHRRILRDDKVIEASVEFICEAAPVRREPEG